MKKLKIPKITELLIKDDLYDKSTQVNAFLNRNQWGCNGECNQLKTFKELLKKNYIIADIGAALGMYTKVAKEKGCRVFSFEPVEANCENIELNTKDYEKVTIINKAVYKETKKLKFKLNLNKTEQGTISNEGIEVEGIKLDDMFDKLDIIKIDVEGAEKEVILGAGKLLDNVKYIFIELHKSNKKVISDWANILLLLQKYNFNLLYIDNSKDKYEKLNIINKDEQPRILAYKNLTDVENKRLWEIINEKD